MKIDRIVAYFKKPYKILLFLDKNRIITLSDKNYIKLQYKNVMHKEINLLNPKTFNEKLQWLKLYNRKHEYTRMVDKYEVKEYVSNIIGEEYIIPTIGVYDKFEDINFNKLPNQFVIKCTHDSGSTIVCTDKSKFNIKEVKNKINKFLKTNYYWSGREWPYKNVKPRIIIEKYMEDKKYKEARDYKVYAFSGKSNYIMVCFDRNKGATKFIYFDKEWNMQKNMSYDGIKYGDSVKVDKPKNLDKMFKFANILSKDIPFVRVDFYEINGRLYFGEMTFFPSAGFDNTRTKECEEILDNLLNLEGLDEYNRIFKK